MSPRSSNAELGEFPLPHYLPPFDYCWQTEYRAALCQIFDSIYLDVPMSRVKFNVNTEYAYLQNFKILQSKHPYPK